MTHMREALDTVQCYCSFVIMLVAIPLPFLCRLPDTAHHGRKVGDILRIASCRRHELRWSKGLGVKKEEPNSTGRERLRLAIGARESGQRDE